MSEHGAGVNRVTVYSTSNSPYQAWQSELLDASFARVGQPGRLVRLCSDDEDPSRPFDDSRFAEVVRFPSFMRNPRTDDFWGIANKINTMPLWLASDRSLAEDDVVLFLDPDMVFVERIDLVPDPGMVIGQRWIDPSVERHPHFERYGEAVAGRLRADTLIMYPFCARAGDMRRVAPRFRDLAQTIRDENPECWEADMYALVIALLEGGLRLVAEEALGVCNNWKTHRERVPPIIHYPARVVDREDNEIWFKQSYTPLTRGRPWKRPAPAEHPTNPLERKLLELIHAHIDEQSAAPGGADEPGRG